MNRMDIFVEQRSFEVPDLRRPKGFGKAVVEPIPQRKAPTILAVGKALFASPQGWGANDRNGSILEEGL
jgi:hypothetical protein